MSLVYSAALYAAASLLVLVLLVAQFLAYVVLQTYLMHLHWKREGLPCAPFIPLVGHMLRSVADLREDRALESYRERTAQYGDLFSLTFGPASRLTVNSPPHIADVLRGKADCYVKGTTTRIWMDPMIGLHNLLLADGAEHAKHRRMINPAFHHTALSDMVRRERTL